jgi:hypothetical protein
VKFWVNALWISAFHTVSENLIPALKMHTVLMVPQSIRLGLEYSYDGRLMAGFGRFILPKAIGWICEVSLAKTN